MVSFYFDVLAKDETMDHKVSTVGPLLNEPISVVKVPRNFVKSRFQCSPNTLITKMLAQKKNSDENNVRKSFPPNKNIIQTLRLCVIKVNLQITATTSQGLRKCSSFLNWVC